MNRIWIAAVLFPALLLCGCGAGAAVTYDIASEGAVRTGSAAAEEPGSASGSDAPDPAEAEEELPPVCVYVCGAVERPGVYELPAGSRVHDAVGMAGGMTGEADARALNLAEPLSDGQQIIVFTIAEVEAGAVPAAAGNTASSGGKVDLNRATKEELMTLPGIGEVKAEAILQYRSEHGGFAAVESLQEISGIGEKTFQRLAELVKV